MQFDEGAVSLKLGQLDPLKQAALDNI